MSHLAHVGHQWPVLIAVAISTFTAVAMGVWVSLRKRREDAGA